MIRSPRYVQAQNPRFPAEESSFFFTEDHDKERELYLRSPRRSPKRDDYYVPSFGDGQPYNRGRILTDYERWRGYPDGRPPLVPHEHLDGGYAHDGRFSQAKGPERYSPVNASPRKIPPWERDMEETAYEREKLKKQEQLEQLEQEKFNLMKQIEELAKEKERDKYEQERELKERERELAQTQALGGYEQQRNSKEKDSQWWRWDNEPWKRKRRDRQDQDQDPERGRRHGYGFGHMTDSWSNRLARIASTNAGTFLFVRFPVGNYGENIPVIAHACVQAKTSDLGGRFAGIAGQVFNFNFNPKKDEPWGAIRSDGYVVFRFGEMDKAEKFYQCDRPLRLRAFSPTLGRPEVFALKLNFSIEVTKDYDTFLLSYLVLNKYAQEQYEEKFVRPMTDLLNREGALPFAAHSKRNGEDRKSVDGVAFGSSTVVTLHMFRTPDDLNRIRCLDDFKWPMKWLHENAVVKDTFFTIDRDACP